MSYLNKSGYKSASEYSVVYSDMKGVDLSLDGSGISRSRFAYLENMYRDYEGEGAGIVESVPGFRKICSFGDGINGLFSYKDSSGYDRIVVHAGGTLRDFALKDADSLGEIGGINGIEDTESDAYRAKDALYVLDGKNIYKLSSSFKGKVSDTDGGIYIPTTYRNGEEYEQRNLLTRAFSEIYNLGSCDSLAYGTPSLKYAVTDEEKLECKLTGIDGDDASVFVPSRVMIGDRYYSITKIENFAFRNNATITECFIAKGVAAVGVMAFYNCKKLTRVVLPDTVTELGNACFADCKALTDLHFGLGLRKLGESLIANCSALNGITYAGGNVEFDAIENTSVLGSTAIVYNQVITECTVGVDIFSPCVSVERVTVGGEAVDFSVTSRDGLCDKIVIRFADKALANGRDAALFGTLSSDPSHYKGRHAGFMASSFASYGEVASVILGCKTAESFDGRIFLTANPDYPGFCFYSALDLTGENNPLYFGEMNYFRDGVGNFGNKALLAAGDSLAVFKAGDDGGGSIYYHTPRDTGVDLVPRIYPVSYIHSGICAKGEAISFFDDPVFISERGVSALAKKTINLERSIETRSTNVNTKLLSERLSEIKLAVWREYLVVMSAGRIYLADSREMFTSPLGHLEYEWYYLSGIGSYRNDSRVYKYASTAHAGYYVHADTDEEAAGTVYSASLGGEMVYYVKDGTKKYEVYPTEELRGGNFYPSTRILAVGDSLIFSTSIGDIMLFNNDKRGVAPPEISAEAGFDAAEYAEGYGRRIHPYYYSFAGHAPRYAVQTKKDNGSIPHLEKSTVKGSLTLKCRAMSAGSLVCEVGADNTGYREVCEFPNNDMLFADIDFSRFTLETKDIYTVPIHEKAKGWVEKQITLYTETFGSPFGVYSIAYRFAVKGKIKKSR